METPLLLMSMMIEFAIHVKTSSNLILPPLLLVVNYKLFAVNYLFNAVLKKKFQFINLQWAHCPQMYKYISGAWLDKIYTTLILYNQIFKF